MDLNKQKVSNRKITKKSPNIWKFNHILLSNSWIIEQDTRKSGSILNKNNVSKFMGCS